MTIRAHIMQRSWADLVEVFIVDHQQDGRTRLLRMDSENDRAYHWEEHEDGAAVNAADDRPTYLLPHDTGRALLQALVEHYQGVEDTRALRRDYDAERKRVDSQAATISDICTALARRSFQ